MIIISNYILPDDEFETKRTWEEIRHMVLNKQCCRSKWLTS